MWPDPRVVELVTTQLIPARVHVRDQAADFRRFGDRYGAHWTPTILLLSPDGEERHRIEGYLPADDLLAQLKLGLGHLAFQATQWSDAERWFKAVEAEFPKSEAAPEALYWAGVSRYKATKDPSHLRDTAKAFSERYQDSSWAKKASIWRE